MGNKSQKISEIYCLSEIYESSKVCNVLRYPLHGESQVAVPYTTYLEKRSTTFRRLFLILEETSHLCVCYLDPHWQNKTVSFEWGH